MKETSQSLSGSDVKTAHSRISKAWSYEKGVKKGLLNREKRRKAQSYPTSEKTLDTFLGNGMHCYEIYASSGRQQRAIGRF